jgi:proline iminopeptidase
VEGFDPTDPYDSGMLDVGGGNQVCWETSGNPRGKPVLVLHGGPGGCSSPGTRRLFDPGSYRIVQFDQRNCGRSVPHPADGLIDLSVNTTQHLVADIELLRERLSIDRWLVWGGSWGTTLGLAYAEEFPDRVTEMILSSVVTTTHAEVKWVTRAMGRVFPEEWQRFRSGVPEADRDSDLSAAYARLLADPDPLIRERAAAEWCRWEDTHVATYPGHRHDTRFDDPRFRLGFATLVTHYWSNAAFLEEEALLDNADRLTGIPGVLIHGRLDISGPADVPWNLAARWSDAELQLLDDAGHGGGSMNSANVAATNRFARRV